MECGAARKYLYGAGALSPATAELAAAKQHVSGCPRCQAFFAAEVRLSRLVKQRAPTEKTPASVRERLLAKIAAERSRMTARPGWKQWAQPFRLAHVLAAALALAAIIISVILQHHSGTITSKELASILIADHVETSPARVQIASSDGEAVRKWFHEQVDFTFRLPPIADPRLIGGRLCDLKGRRAALIIYQHPSSKVSLFILDGRDIELPEERLISLDEKRCLLNIEKGYNAVLWKERGLLYGLVSDAPSTDLLQLATKF
jgi:anti-sigma factor RsiW